MSACWYIYLHSSTIALLSFLHKTVSTDWRSLQACVVWFVQQAAGAAARQVFLIVVAAAAAESARDVPAGGKTYILRVSFVQWDRVGIVNAMIVNAF